MRRKAAGLLFGILSLLCIAAAPASAAESDSPPPGCFADRYGLLFGQGIAVTCDYSFGPYEMYQVIAHCSTGGTYWYSRGSWVPYGFGPSVAECHGGLLNTAGVVGYHVNET
ncbi:hypothetical protein [Amycolatopsis nigrescens]|uniref:hypothetical protein n=1 Tax=Amycolatopsis nigrescens TaxID=381445 RepID=UPI00058BAC93|nr:hypothetical protein [Amycolatopsis nigrescens]